MGGKVSIRRNKKKKREQNETVNTEAYVDEEPVYMEIGFDEDVSSHGSHGTFLSSDSAFSERTLTLTRSVSSSTVSYDRPGCDVPEESVDTETVPKSLYLGRRDDCQAGNVDENNDDDYSDVHTYISLRDRVSKEVTRRCGTVIPLEEVPYMVEAFQPLLERTIDVMEVLPEMPFIDTYEFVKVDDQRKAVAMLVARIKGSDEPGKWKAFLHALNLTGYEYIVSLLRGETEDDHSVNRNLLRLFTPQIMNRIEPEEFIDHLFEKRVINERDMEEVRSERERRGAIAASFMLLHKVPRRISNWFEVFLDVLSTCGMEDVVKHFRIPEVPVSTMIPFVRPRKKRSRGKFKQKPRDTNQDYITPIYNTGRFRPDDPLPPTPPQLPNRGLFALTHVQETVQKHTTSEFKLILESQPKSKLEILQEKKYYLQKRVEEKRLKKLNMEVEYLQKVLEELGSEDEAGSEDNGDKDTQSNGTANENPFSDSGSTLTIEKGNDGYEDLLKGNNSESAGHNENDFVKEDVIAIDKECTQGTEMNYNSEDNNFVNSVPAHDTVGQRRNEELISKLFIDMKQEFKQDIFAMRDHVTDAVLKYIISSSTRPASSEDYAYVKVEDEQTVLSTPVKVFSTTPRRYPGMLCPTSHLPPRIHSVDSAMFSDYNYYFV